MNISMIEREHDCICRIEPGRHVSEWKAWKNRRTVCIAVHRCKTRAGLDHRTETGSVRTGTATGPTGNADHHQAPVVFVEYFPAQTISLHRSGHERFDHNIEAWKEPQ